MCNPEIIAASKDFVPVFIDTLSDGKTTRRFSERFGSYPVLRIHNWKGQELAGRINSNLTAGIIDPQAVLDQLALGLRTFSP